MLGLGFIGGNDAGDQRVAHDVFFQKFGKSQAAHIFQDFAGFAQATLLAFGQVDLGQVTGDDGLGANPDSGVVFCASSRMMKA